MKFSKFFLVRNTFRSRVSTRRIGEISKKNQTINGNRLKATINISLFEINLMFCPNCVELQKVHLLWEKPGLNFYQATELSLKSYTENRNQKFEAL